MPRKKGQKQRAVCINGHSLQDESNVYLYRDDNGIVHRHCKTCRRNRARNYRQSVSTGIELTLEARQEIYSILSWRIKLNREKIDKLRAGGQLEAAEDLQMRTNRLVGYRELFRTSRDGLDSSD